MNQTCGSHEHLSRRALLKGTLAAGGGLLMNWGGLAHSPAFSAEVRKDQKHCILLWMNGGASQFETFDMKPGRRTGGLFRPVSTNLPGTQICELMPKIAQQMDKLAVVRSMKTSEVDHPGGIYLMHTGYRPTANIRYPEIGAIAARYLGHDEADLPNFVKVSSNGDAGAGFLGPKYQPFSIGSEGGMPPFSVSQMKQDVELRRHELRTFVEEEFTKTRRAVPFRMHQESYEAARRLQKAREAFKIDGEWDQHRELYGDSQFGRRCLLARKLVESGVPFIE